MRPSRGCVWVVCPTVGLLAARPTGRQNQPAGPAQAGCLAHAVGLSALLLQGHEFGRAALIHRLLRETPSSEVEWILYMDPQTLFDQPSYVFNFEFYAGRDLVLSCDLWKVKSGETGAPPLRAVVLCRQACPEQMRLPQACSLSQAWGLAACCSAAG